VLLPALSGCRLHFFGERYRTSAAIYFDELKAVKGLKLSLSGDCGLAYDRLTSQSPVEIAGKLIAHPRLY
jgi:hypothetical protein